MSDFQNRFMKIVDSANHTNLDLVGRYKEDSSEAVDDLYRGLSELQHTKAHINELYDRSALKLFFDGLEYRFNTELKKYTLEFTEDVNETFKSYDKKLKNLFVEEGVSGKDIYTHIEGNSEGEYSAFTAKANNIHVDTSLLSDVQTQISNNSEKIIKKSRLKKLFFGIIIPAVLIIVIVAGLKIASDNASNAVRDGMVNAVSGFGVNEQTAGAVVDAVTNIIERLTDSGSPSKISVYTISSFIIIAVWLIYYTILGAVIKSRMNRKLGQSISDIYLEFSKRKPEFQDIYEKWLTAHLNGMAAKYFMKYKPLIDIVIGNEVR